jgi:MoaA/NifB/PqqE/SkfB family radical SAM enzyme
MNYISEFDYENLFLKTQQEYVKLLCQNKLCPPYEVEIQMSSVCNMFCDWCIGKELRNRRLPNLITKDNIENIINDLLSYEVNGLKINRFKFSGFMGEPLIQKEATLKAIDIISKAKRKIGLFTNGLLMEEDIWEHLLKLDYLHLSLDGGENSFDLMKGVKQGTFQKVMDNLDRLCKYRSLLYTPMKINVGYIIVPQNSKEIYDTVKLVHECGADSIRFKCDITQDNQSDIDIKEIFEEIKRASSDFSDEDFQVIVIHNQENMITSEYKTWNKDIGCHFHKLFTTVGSDGCLYSCDFNTFKDVEPIGNLLTEPFAEMWERRKRFSCKSNVCPPYANAVNPIMEKLLNKKD